MCYKCVNATCTLKLSITTLNVLHLSPFFRVLWSLRRQACFWTNNVKLFFRSNWRDLTGMQTNQSTTRVKRAIVILGMDPTLDCLLALYVSLPLPAGLHWAQVSMAAILHVQLHTKSRYCEYLSPWHHHCHRTVPATCWIPIQKNNAICLSASWQKNSTSFHTYFSYAQQTGLPMVPNNHSHLLNAKHFNGEELNWFAQLSVVQAIYHRTQGLMRLLICHIKLVFNELHFGRIG